MANYQEFESDPREELCEGLSDKALRELLAEIEADDDEVNSLEESFLEADELDREIDELTEKVNAPRSKAYTERNQRIAAEAFAQANINLADPLTTAQLKRLITLLTQERREIMTKHEAFINRRLRQLLISFIPQQLRRARVKFPQAVLATKGFMYEAQGDHETQLFWAVPDLPAYFEQGTEMELLRNERAEFLATVDKTVIWYNKAKASLAEREIKIASRLLRMKKSTWHELLKLCPLWFEVLYNDVTQTTLCE